MKNKKEPARKEAERAPAADELPGAGLDLEAKAAKATKPAKMPKADRTNQAGQCHGANNSAGRETNILTGAELMA